MGQKAEKLDSDSQIGMHRDPVYPLPSRTKCQLWDTHHIRDILQTPTLHSVEEFEDIGTDGQLKRFPEESCNHFSNDQTCSKVLTQIHLSMYFYGYHLYDIFVPAAYNLTADEAIQVFE